MRFVQSPRRASEAQRREQAHGHWINAYNFFDAKENNQYTPALE
jgi:hypothetical protein